MKLDTIWGAFAKPFLKIAGGVFLGVLVVSLYYKLVKFLYTIPFPCEVHEYDFIPDSVYCTSAEVLAMITTMLTIFAVVGYIVHEGR